jgi:hypothetical protein
MTEPNAVVATWGYDWRQELPVYSPPEQAALLANARQAVVELQQAASAHGRAGHALHRKTLYESASATFEIASDIPKVLRIGPFLPNATWPAVIRLSSAFPIARPDDVPDQRGLGVHIVDHERRLDLLATTGEAHHARDAEAMIASLKAAAKASRGGVRGKLSALVTLIGAIGASDALQLTRTVSRAAESGRSLAALTFYSRAPFQLGEFAVRYRFAPPASLDATVRGSGADSLSQDLRARLANGPVSWSFELQGYLDPHSTPMHDHRIAWRSPWIAVARLTLPNAAVADWPMALRAAPTWPASNGPVLEPLGDLNMLRGAAYEASQTGRS